jgi:hypothetical protein
MERRSLAIDARTFSVAATLKRHGAEMRMFHPYTPQQYYSATKHE